MKILSTSPLSEMNFRAVGGRRLIDMYQQLIAVLGARVKGREITSFLAKPNINRRTNQLEWSTDLAGTQVEALTELDDERRDKLLQEVAACVSEVEGVATAFSESADRARQADAELFAAVVGSISERDIFLVDGHPVIVNWGVDIAGEQSGPVELRSAVNVPVAPPPPAAPLPPIVVEPAPVRRRWRPLWWLLAVICLLLLILLLSRGCVPLGLDAQAPNLVPLPAPDTALPREDLDLEGDLRREIDELNRKLREGVFACIAPPETPISPSDRAGREEEERRLKERGITVGEVTVSLYWETRHDLDLYVINPQGQTISYSSKSDRWGGRLDTDSNATKSERTTAAVEVVSWASNPPTGTYQVFVKYYRADEQSGARANPGSYATDFRVVVNVRGDRKVFRDRLGPTPGSLNGPKKKIATFVVE
jgi:hypothetical protein